MASAASVLTSLKFAAEVTESRTGASVVAGTDSRAVESTTGANEDVDWTTPFLMPASGLDEEPKLLDAVVEAPLLTVTLLTITTSPSTLVILTSTVVVPKPLEFSKKL